MSPQLAVAIDEIIADFRAHRCEGCLEPIPLKTRKYCYMCDPTEANKRTGGYGPYDDPSPGWENMVRLYEDYNCA